ncbi:unnamed protein product [Toxocara canis]|uniref:Transposase n=1 Tax=Toxocara canis TaxID=6265 RepID=A0A183UH44_TOXCA|nr:unnamed protein product [Toxocara canis]
MQRVTHQWRSRCAVGAWGRASYSVSDRYYETFAKCYVRGSSMTATWHSPRTSQRERVMEWGMAKGVTARGGGVWYNQARHSGRGCLLFPLSPWQHHPIECTLNRHLRPPRIMLSGPDHSHRAVVSAFTRLAATTDCGTAVRYDDDLRILRTSRREPAIGEIHQGMAGVGGGAPAFKKWSQRPMTVSRHGEYGPPKKNASPAAL